MKFKIIVDSSSNLLNSSFKNDDKISFSSVPLTFMVGDQEFVDDDNLNVKYFLDKVKENNGGKSSCPSPQKFFDELVGADYYFIVTITSKLSGSFNSACVARNMFDKPNNVFVINSKGTAGTLVLIVEKLKELIYKGASFESITNEIIDFRDSLNLLFALDKFDNLVRNGRVSKVTAFIAQIAAIKPLCYAEDGDIKIKEKIRTFRGVLKRMIHYIEKMNTKNFEDQICIIAHTQNEEFALELKSEIERKYNFKEVIIMENRGLCSFYSLEGGIILTF